MRSTTDMRKKVLSLGCAALALTSLWAIAQEAAAPVVETATVDENVAKAIPPTEITADSLEYDMKNRLAHLVGNVHVIDQDLDLTSEKMVIYFVYSEAEQRDQVQRIEATGNVRMTRDKVVATGKEATYTVDKGLVVLTGEPMLIQGNSKITGADEVIFNRNEERVYTNGGKPKIEFYRSDNEQSSIADALKGDGRKAADSDGYTR